MLYFKFIKKVVSLKNLSSIFTGIVPSTVCVKAGSSMISVVVRIFSVIGGKTNNSQSSYVSKILANPCLTFNMKYSHSLQKLLFKKILRCCRTLLHN